MIWSRRPMSGRLSLSCGWSGTWSRCRQLWARLRGLILLILTPEGSIDWAIMASTESRTVRHVEKRVQVVIAIANQATWVGTTPRVLWFLSLQSVRPLKGQFSEIVKVTGVGAYVIHVEDYWWLPWQGEGDYGEEHGISADYRWGLCNTGCGYGYVTYLYLLFISLFMLMIILIFFRKLFSQWYNCSCSIWFGYYRSFLSLAFNKKFYDAPATLDFPLEVEIADDRSLSASRIHHGCILNLFS